MPFFESLDRRLMFDGTLWDAVVVDFEVVAQRRFKLGSGAKTRLSNDLADAAIEALHHAVGLWMARWNQPVFDRQGFAENVEGVLAGWDAVPSDRVFFLAGKAVGKLTAVVGQ